MLDVTEVLRDLVSFKSVTPQDDGCLDYISDLLSKRSFVVTKKEIAGATCLYARLGNKGRNLCLSGHTDVVPHGDLSFWKSDPFQMVEKDGNLYGRGVCDMKGGVAAMLVAVDNVLSKNPQLCAQNSLSFLLTSDEEKAGVTSCKYFLEELEQMGEKIDHCLIGEPTSYVQFGDYIKVGRRGSCTIDIKVIGKGGHVAYPQLCNNPARALVSFLNAIQNHIWDSGTQQFEPSNLEVVGISSSENTSNLIPNYATAKLNIRFNVLQSAEDIVKVVKTTMEKEIKPPFITELSVIGGNRPFVSKGGRLSAAAKNAIKNVVGLEAKESTGGGSSDGAYISQYCDDLLEFGVINSTAHKANEHIAQKDLKNLVLIYQQIIEEILI